MNQFNNSVAVVTGAGSGIGQALAQRLAQYGAKVAISDIDETGLQQTHQLIKNQTSDVHSTTLDVSDREAMFHYAETVKQELGPANLVVNNAGVALVSGTFQKTTINEFEWLMSINFSGVLYGTKAFLPQMEQASWGHIVNISSLFGLIGVPEQTAYNSSKFAVRGLTEALRQELELENSHISCTSVHPGGVKTNIARSARVGETTRNNEAPSPGKHADDFDKLARTTADSAAQQILKAVVQNKRRLLIGNDAKLMDWMQRHFPNHYQRFLQWVIKRATKD